MLQNKYRIVGDIAYISLTKGQEAMIDVSDLEKVLEEHWHTRQAGKYALYAHSRRQGYMHRFLLDAPRRMYIEHLNHNTLDNRRANLRVKGDRQGETYRIEGNLAYIALTKGQETVIDTSDVEKVIPYSWQATNHTMNGYYASTNINKKTVFLHRFLLDAPKGTTVDHRNHETLDNRRSNLRIVSNQENNANRNGANRLSKTGIRGVSVHKKNSGNLLYVFKCSCVTCKACEYFPYTEEGLEDARVYSEWHFKAMENPEEAGPEPEKKHYERVAPMAKVTGKIDARGVSIANTSTGTYYFFRCRREACPSSKYFPYTDEGLEAAKQYSQEHYAAITQ